MQYLGLNGLLSDRQFGVCKSRSTEDQMLLVYSEIASVVDSVGWLLTWFCWIF